MDAVSTPRLVILATLASSDLAFARASSDSFRCVTSSESAIRNRGTRSVPGTIETLLRAQTDLPILASVLLLDLKLLALSVEQFADQRPILFDILFVGDVKESKLLQFILGVSQHLLEDEIRGDKPAIQVGKGNADGGVLKNRPPPFLAAHDLRMSHTESVFASFALGDIANVASEGRRAVLRDARDCKLDRDFSSIGTECSHFKPPAQYSRLAGSQVAGKPRTVFLAERRWDDDISKTLAQHVLPTVTERLFRCGVEFRNATFMVNRHDAIGR